MLAKKAGSQLALNLFNSLSQKERESEEVKDTSHLMALKVKERQFKEYGKDLSNDFNAHSKTKEF